MLRAVVVVLAVLVAASSARAQPLTGDVTPTVVEPIDPTLQLLSPELARNGNVRVSISCADSWMTPEGGMTVTADGARLWPRRDNGTWSTVTDDDGTSDVWSATDTGFVVAPGHHRIEIDAPGCAPAVFDVDAYADHARWVTGRLAVTDPWLMGTAGAPNGIGVVLGVVSATSPDHGDEQAFASPDQTNHFDPQTGTGGWLSITFERRRIAFAIDQAFLESTISGNSTSSSGSTTTSQPFQGHSFDWRSQFRIGARLPLRDVALSIGSGIGGDMWFDSSTLSNASTTGAFLTPPDGVGGGFYFPMWAAATIKPSCGWGIQVLGQYDIHPVSSSADGYELAAGLIFQGSDACSEPPGVRVSTE